MTRTRAPTWARERRPATARGRWTPNSPLGAGDHYIVATYTSNNSTFVGGTVGEFDQTVYPATTSVAISTSPTYVNGSVELDATVSVVTGQGTPTGSVEFYDGTADLGGRHGGQQRPVEPDHLGRAAWKPNAYGRLQRRR